MQSPNKSPGRLERVLRAGAFAVTAETTPPLSADPAAVVRQVAPLKGLADAVNVTDGAGALAHMSGLAASRLLVEDGIEPVLQFTSRDRNKLAIERDLLGAAALGAPNVLCLSGDPIGKGDEPDATAVNDVNSAGLASLAARLRDAGRLPSGREIKAPPRYLIGVADTPLDPPADWRPDALAAKIEAGADFVQTQFCFDPDLLLRYIEVLAANGLAQRVFILVGIGPLASARQARWMVENLPGTVIPQALIDRLERASDPRAEGRRICIELIERLRGVEHVAGVHLMGPRAEAESARAIAESGILDCRDGGDAGAP